MEAKDGSSFNVFSVRIFVYIFEVHIVHNILVVYNSRGTLYILYDYYIYVVCVSFATWGSGLSSSNHCTEYPFLWCEIYINLFDSWYNRILMHNRMTWPIRTRLCFFARLQCMESIVPLTSLVNVLVMNSWYDTS